MLSIISGAMHIATRTDTQAMRDRERYFHRRAAEENDAAFHRQMLKGAERHWR